MNPFTGKIEKRIMGKIKKVVEAAEKKYAVFIKTREAQYEQDRKALEVTFEAEKVAKEESIVDEVLGKFV